MNFFQTIILTVFALIAVVAVVIFSMQSSTNGTLSFSGTFTVWGTLPSEKVKETVDRFNGANKKLFLIKYVEKKKDSFQGDLVSSLASGNGPDLVILPESLISQNLNKIVPIPYEEYSERGFLDNFIDGSSLYLVPNGIFALPLYVDPVVMYWNKDIFSTGGVATFPQKWSDFGNIVNRLTKSDRSGNISQSAVAMGTYSNINHSKDILSALFLQAGNDIVGLDPSLLQEDAETVYPFRVYFGRGDLRSQESALRFFLEFSNSAKSFYSWNTAMPNSKSAFTGGILGIYFGHASDYKDIQKANPHLNFDVAVLPQRDIDKKSTTFGNIYGVAVTRGTSNISAARNIAIEMSRGDFVRNLYQAIYLPPARRDILAQGTNDSIMSVFYSSAIISKSWFDLMPVETLQIFKEMVESVTSGLKKEGDAIGTANQRFNGLIKN